MEHQDDGQEGREKLAEVDPCPSEGCMQIEPTRDLQPCKKQHFTFSLVNLYGTSEINSIVEGKLLKLSGNYLSCYPFSCSSLHQQIGNKSFSSLFQLFLHLLLTGILVRAGCSLMNRRHRLQYALFISILCVNLVHGIVHSMVLQQITVINS